MDRKRSEVWKFFKIINEKRASCNFCEQEMNAISSNMKKHLVAKHPTAGDILVEVDEEDDVPSLFHQDDDDDSSDTFTPKKAESPKKYTMEKKKTSPHKSDDPMTRKRSVIWKFFDIINDRRCLCKLCGKPQSAINSNMKKHLRVKHPTANDIQSIQSCVKFEKENDNSSDSDKVIDKSKDEETAIMNEDPENESKEEEYSFINTKGQRSFVWEFFDKLNHRRAICRLCNKEQSCVTTNLKHHLDKAHSGIPVLSDDVATKPFDERFNENDSSDSFNYPEEIPTASTFSAKKNKDKSTLNIKQEIMSVSKPIYSSRSASTNMINVNSMYMERKRSSVWKYFRIINSNRAMCNICGKEQSNVISNCKKHLHARHPKAFKEMVKGSTTGSVSATAYSRKHQVSVIKRGRLILPKKRRHKAVSYVENDSDEDYVQEATPSSSTTKTRRLLNKKNDEPASSADLENIKMSSSQISDKISNKADQILLKLIIKHFQDYSIVQDSEIVSFIRTINKSYKLPSKDVISNNLIPDLYERCLFQTKLHVKSCKKLCMTIDCWSNIHATNFISITIHYIDDNYVLNSVLLDCSVIQKQDTPANLAQDMRSTLTSWNLKEDNVLLAILDSTVSNIKCVFTDELKWDAQECFANVINSIAKDSFSNEWIQNIIDKIKDLINHFKGCEFSAENLMVYQTQNNAVPLKLIKDFPRCWNSTFLMLQRFIDLEEAIKSSLVLVEKELQTLSILEWEVVRQLVNCVKPMDHVMNTIKKEPNFCTASLVIPLIHGLKNVYNNLSSKQLHNPVKEVLNNIVTSLNENFDGVETVDSYCLATFLDPRFKHKAFSSPTVGDLVRDKVINILSSDDNNFNCTFQNKRPAQLDENDPHSDFWSFFQDNTKTDSDSSQSSRIRVEVQRYVEDGVIPRTEVPLIWWSKNAVSFPHLAELARERLCCVASSVPCERYFSKKGQNAIENRQKLSTKKTQMLVFLNANYVSENK